MFTSFGQNTAEFYDKHILAFNRALYILARFGWNHAILH